MRQGKERKGFQIGKSETKVSLFSGHMILNIEKPKESTKELLNLIKQLNKIAGTEPTKKDFEPRNIFKEIMAEYLLNFIKEINPQIQEVSKSRRNPH
jgi:hypothetical protein